MNKVYIIGRLTKDVEMSSVKDVDCGKFSLASKSNRKDGAGNYITEFFNCVAWGERAKLIKKFCKKGTQISVTGSLYSYKYESDGKVSVAWTVNVDDFEFIQPQQVSVDRVEKTEVDDEDLPF